MQRFTKTESTGQPTSAVVPATFPSRNIIIVRNPNSAHPATNSNPLLASPDRRLRNSLRRETDFALSNNRNQHRLFPSTISELGQDRMQRSFKGARELKNMKSSQLNSNLTEKLQQIRNKCMKDRSSKVSIGKGLLGSKQDAESELNESEDLDDVNTEKNVNAKAYLRRSKYSNRPTTIFFHYPKCCGQPAPPHEVEKLLIPLEGKCELKYKLAGQEYKCIMNTLQYNGFTRTDGSQWNIFFDITGTQMDTLASMNRYQKMSHFPGCWTLGRKDYMWKVLNKAKRRLPVHYDFVPATYLFPSDFDRFEMIRESQSKDHLWIIKPSNAACGRGIKMITKETKIKNKKDHLVSEYIRNPHLINDLKYDLRIYIFVTSYDPLRIYMFNEGLTRFATHKYSTKVKQIKKRFIHLTNFSVNKHSKNFVKNQNTNEDGKGSKWSLTALKSYYEANGINSNQLFDRIKDIIIKTCISAEPNMLDIHSKSQERRSCGFELYGFDILVDSNLKPWLIEVNVCPSLSSSSPMDRRIKHTLLTDMLNLVGLEYFDKKKFADQTNRQKQKVLLGKTDKKTFSKNIKALDDLNIKNCVEMLSPEDWMILFETQEELERRGNFERIYPNKNNVDTYLPLFEIPRYNNLMVAKWLKSDKNFLSLLY